MRHNGLMRTVVVDGKSTQIPIDEIRQGLQRGLPEGAVIQHSADGGVTISHGDGSFALPPELIERDLPELRETIGGR